jgi:hypothetical protein
MDGWHLLGWALLVFIAAVAAGGAVELWAIRQAARDQLPRRLMFLLPGKLRAQAGERHRARMLAPDSWVRPVGHEPLPVGGRWFCLWCNQQVRMDRGLWVTSGPDARPSYCAERVRREESV